MKKKTGRRQRVKSPYKRALRLSQRGIEKIKKYGGFK